MSAAASAAALLLFPLLAAAGDGVCPRPPAAAAVLQQASCPAADAPGIRGHHAGVVEGLNCLKDSVLLSFASSHRGVYVTFLRVQLFLLCLGSTLKIFLLCYLYVQIYVHRLIVFTCQGDDGALQKAVTLVLQNREDFVAILFYASWCPFSKIFRTDFQKLSSFFPIIAHFSFEESRIEPRILSRYGIRAFPTLFLVNSTVRVRYHGSRTMNSLAMFYKDVTGMNPVSLDATSLERMEDTVNVIGNDKKTDQEDYLFLWARSPDRLLHQDTCLALASSFVLLRLLHFLLPKLNACLKQAWRMRLYELNRLFPSLS